MKQFKKLLNYLGKKVDYKDLEIHGKKGDPDFLVKIDNGAYYLEIKHTKGIGLPLKKHQIDKYEREYGKTLILYVRNHESKTEEFTLANLQAVDKSRQEIVHRVGNRLCYFLNAEPDQWFKFDKLKKDYKLLNKFQTKLNKELSIYNGR